MDVKRRFRVMRETLGNSLSWIGREVDLDDLLFALGWVLIVCGVAAINPAAGAIVGGVILLLGLRPLWSWLK